jgi:hypothetical protein
MGRKPFETDEDVRRFSKRLRRLDVDTFAQLVTDLWVARGRTATRDGATIVVRDGQTTHHLVAVHTAPPAESDARVVTSRVSDDPTVLDAAELLRVVRYAVERDHSAAILEQYLGDGAATFCSPGTVSTESTQFHWWQSLSVSRLLVAIVAVFVLTSSGAIVSEYNSASREATSSADATSQSEGLTRTTTVSNQSSPTVSDEWEVVDYGAVGCPPPPTSVFPRSLRPDVVPGASATGLDGWRIVNESNQSQSVDLDRLVSFNPVAQHTATYVPPSGQRLTLRISLWQSERLAATATSAFASANETVVRLGQYTLVVRAMDTAGGSLSQAQTVEWARTLLSEVRGTSGSRLGFRCVEALLGETEPDAESTVSG